MATAVPPGNRIENWPEANDRTCGRCLNVGMIEVAGPEHPGDEGFDMAPCPSCVKGFRIEFGVYVKRNLREEVVNQWEYDVGRAPWGVDGYWQGRKPPPIKEPPTPDEIVAAAARVHEMGVRTGSPLIRELAAKIGRKFPD